MGHMLLTLYEQTKEQKYLDIIMSKVDYLENNALRFGDGVLQHTVSAKTIFRSNAGRTPCLWRDISYCAQGDAWEKPLIDDALHQFYWHIHYLQDEDTSLWYHGYNHLNKDHMSECIGRAPTLGRPIRCLAWDMLPQAYLYLHLCIL